MMGLIVLHDLLLSEVEHRDGLIGSTCQHALGGGMEGGAGDGSIEAVILLDFLSLLNIPNDELFVLSS